VRCWVGLGHGCHLCCHQGYAPLFEGIMGLLEVGMGIDDGTGLPAVLPVDL